MQNILVVVDMQNDFIYGTLGTKEAVSIVPSVIEKVKSFGGTVLFTRDTHFKDYADTQEGTRLPVEHCICGTYGWEIQKDLDAIRKTVPVDKYTFGSAKLGQILLKMNSEEEISSITFVGVCTDICVISNALLVKAFLPETRICVDASCCAGVTPASHENALAAMQACQIDVIRPA